MFTSQTLQFSKHAQTRMAQRGISIADVEYVFHHGTCIWRAGAQHRVLRRVDIPEQDTKRKWRLNGTVVVLDSETQKVLTVYRNTDAFSHIRRKPKWGRSHLH